MSVNNCMLRAAVNLGFFRFLRCAEFTVPSLKDFDAFRHLSLQDVSVVQSPCISAIVIRIKCSKTDQFGNRMWDMSILHL